MHVQNTQRFDAEVKQILDRRMAHVLELLRDQRAMLDRVSALLLEKEVIETEEFEAVIRQNTRKAA